MRMGEGHMPGCDGDHATLDTMCNSYKFYKDRIIKLEKALGQIANGGNQFPSWKEMAVFAHEALKP